MLRGKNFCDFSTKRQHFYGILDHFDVRARVSSASVSIYANLASDFWIDGSAWQAFTAAVGMSLRPGCAVGAAVSRVGMGQFSRGLEGHAQRKIRSKTQSYAIDSRLDSHP
jgi:hypothetical protein